MSQKSQALSVPGILMMVKVKDKVQTVAVRRCQTNAILISREGSGLSSEGEADRLLGERRLQPALTQRTWQSMAPSFIAAHKVPGCSHP